ncbi:MAG: GvpL/GvpF family gas vesicle protein [bacterium]
MAAEGKYIYCIIGSSVERSFGPLGIGPNQDEVTTVGYDDLAMVISNHPLGRLEISKENLLGHERVVEEIMKEFPAVLPVRFGTIATSADEIRNLLDRRYREFRDLLAEMEYKVEWGVKGTWIKMPRIYEEILVENPSIRSLKRFLEENPEAANDEACKEAGYLVAQALEKKKETDRERVLETLQGAAYDVQINPKASDEMFINASFLVDRGREMEFDNLMEELDHDFEGRARFLYTGPLPPYNFVHISIYPEPWEV